MLRPRRPDITLALGRVAAEHQSVEALLEAVTQGPATFLGFLMKHRGVSTAVDQNGENAIELEPGDIFAEPSSLVPDGPSKHMN